MQIEFTVLGRPCPAGSKRGFPMRGKGGKVSVRVVDANKNAEPWKALVAHAARQAYSGELLRGPLDVEMTFYQKRPKGHFGTGRNAGRLKASAPQNPTTKPDVLKLARGTEDALSGIIYADDCQTIGLNLRKRYGEPERAEISVIELTP